MSYMAGMSFGNITDKSEILDIITKITNAIWNKKESIIQEYRQHMPNVHTKDGKEKNTYYLYELMQTSILYWEKYNLIAIYGLAQNEFQERFPAHIKFQDAYDNDYEYHIYDGIHKFEELRTQIQNASPQEILNHIHKHMDENVTLEELLEDEDYMRKTALYCIIEDILEIPEWIAGEQPTKCQIFNVTPFNNWERVFQCNDILNSNE